MGVRIGAKRTFAPHWKFGLATFKVFCKRPFAPKPDMDRQNVDADPLENFCGPHGYHKESQDRDLRLENLSDFPKLL